MAYTTVQSGEIPEGTQYYSGKLPLGDYNFYLKVDATGVSPKIVTQCESPDGTMRTASSRTWPSGTQIRGWSVEANETEASVYVQVNKYEATGGIAYSGGEVQVNIQPDSVEQHNFVSFSIPDVHFASFMLGRSQYVIAVSDSSSFVMEDIAYDSSRSVESTITATAMTYNGTTVYVANSGEWYTSPPIPTVPTTTISSDSELIPSALEQIMQPSKDGVGHLVCRFAIDLGTAGGGPGGGWTQPGDWNPDPTTTLHLTVNGALSGRHNDPIVDPSFSYLPAEDTAQAGYGCGGDGGHGGGGGAGASTVIIHKFATSKANSKELTAIARPHGYGSGGGKGGKGGDGIILIYY